MGLSGDDARSTGHASTSAALACITRPQTGHHNTTAAPDVASGITTTPPTARSSSEPASREPPLSSTSAASAAAAAAAAADNTFWCFYQAADGLQYFLHPLNVRSCVCVCVCKRENVKEVSPAVWSFPCDFL